MSKLKSKSKKSPAKGKAKAIRTAAARLSKESKKVNKQENVHIPRVPEHGFPIRVVKDKDKGITQITVDNKRWYTLDKGNEILVVPGTTYVVDSTLPKGKGFENWLLSSSFEEAARKLTSAGERGTRVHAAIAHFIKHGELDFERNDYEFLEGVPFTAKEFYHVERFNDIWNIFRPKAVTQVEDKFVNEVDGYGGTIDLVAMVDEAAIESFNPHLSKKGYGIVTGGEPVLTVFDWTVSPDVRDGKKVQAHAYARTVGAKWVICCSLDSPNNGGFKVWKSKVNDPNEDWFGVFKNLLAVFNFFHGHEIPEMLRINQRLKITR